MADALWVLLDTDAWSRIYVRRNARDTQADAWRDSLLGRSVAIAVQTRAEVLAGIEMSGWGDRRREPVVAQLDATVTVPVDTRVIGAWVHLTASCRAAGHPLHEKLHASDRWIGATAIAHGLPLLSGDRIFREAPGVTPWITPDAPL